MYAYYLGNNNLLYFEVTVTILDGLLQSFFRYAGYKIVTYNLLIIITYMFFDG